MELLNQIGSQTAILGFSFATIVFMVGAFGYWFVDETPIVKRRLKAIQHSRDRKREEHRQGAFNVKWVEPVARLVLPTSDWENSRLRTRLVHAGYRSNRAFYTYGATKVLLAVLFPVVALVFFLGVRTTGTDNTSTIILLVIALAVGFYLPDVYLAQRTRERQRILRESFPDALDLMVVCVEAGLGLDAAIQRVSKELENSHPELAVELGLVSLETKAGKSKEEALRSLAFRTGLPEIKSMASILIQAEQFGTSIAVSLSGHADEMRNIRIQNAREKAAKLPVKMIFPVVLFIFPALFLVILGPAVIRIARSLMIVGN